MTASFPARVARAARRLSGRFRGRDPFDRRFDDCFEMFDGACVAAALMRRAETDVALRLGIRLHMDEARWTRTAAGLAHLDDAGLRRMAAKQRAEGREETRRMLRGSAANSGDAPCAQS